MPDSLASLEPEKVVTVLAIGESGEDQDSLQSLFRHTNWRLQEVSTARAALEHIRANSTPVVLCERDLPDGNWQDVFFELTTLPEIPLLIVTSRQADDLLWAQVLNLGAYDVLPKPYERAELVRVIGSAWLHWKQRPDRKQPAPTTRGRARRASM